MALNKVILFGRLVRDPEYRQTNSGISVCRFTVACDRQFANKETGKRDADFIEVQAWRNTADFVSRYFTKGSAITVDGTLRNNNYEDKNGVKHFSYFVMAEAVGFGGDSRADSGQQQTGNYNVPQNLQNHAQPNQASNLNMDEFEEILGDGEIPF